jgi:hypothetical protein
VKPGKGEEEEVVASLFLIAFTMAWAESAAGPTDSRGDSLMSQREQLAQQVAALGQLDPLEPGAIARTLGVSRGKPRQVTERRAEYALTGSELLAEGTIVVGPGWVTVTLKPAPKMGLLLEDVEPALLDRPYGSQPQVGHFGDGPRVRAIDHLFAVPAGMIVLEVPPPDRQESYEGALRRAYEEEIEAAAAPGAARPRITAISVTTNVRPGLDDAPTLRAFREWAARASRSEE